MNSIYIKGARENNLKGFDIHIPKKQLVVVTGKSGSGKSSLIFDIIAKESQRQLNETYPLYIRHKLPLYERPKADLMENLSPAIVVDQKQITGSSRSTVATLIDVAPLLRLLFSRCGTPSAGVATAYSFNSPRGMCPTCKGLGETVGLDLDKLLDKEKSLNEGAIQFKPWATNTWQWRLYGHSGFFDNDKPLKLYTGEEWHNLLHGSGRKVIIENDPSGVWYEGVVDRFNRLYLHKDLSSTSKSLQKSIQSVVTIALCPECQGRRLNQAALNSKIDGFNIDDVFELEILDLISFLAKIKGAVGESLADEILAILNKVSELGLSYLTLSRKTETLSGGEAQRLKLVKHLRSSLTDMTYIFDEPSTGLHSEDIDKIIHIIAQLRDKGNSVLIVEHDPIIIQIADQVIEIGPQSGQQGGELIFQGTILELHQQTHSITGHWLNQPLTLKPANRTFKNWIEIEQAQLHNLKNVTVKFPKKALSVVTGVSGSGKTSLVLGELVKQHPKAVVLDQKPVGISNRSNLATYLGIMDLIRNEMAQKLDISPSILSFNSQGKCPNCQGKGVIEADMVFADPVIVICEECSGERYSKEALAHRYKGKNIAEILAMTGEQASSFFDDLAIKKKLSVIQKVGLDYITLGQSTSTLSGGELQRMKLADKLNVKNHLYLLDEPSNGLHMDDIDQLIQLLHTIVDEGNTVIVIEHDLQIIAACDWIVEMGPKGGKFGGEVCFMGTPSEIMNHNNLLTTKWLKRMAE